MAFRLANINDRAALVDGDDYYDLATISGGLIGPDPMDAVAKGASINSIDLASIERSGAVSDVVLGAPVPRPRNCLAVGLNYKSHAAESEMELPENPLVFTKFPSCIVAPDSEVELRSTTADYEVELVVVIGTAGRDIAAADAWDHVIGVTMGQDISDRALQFAAKPPHFDLAKSRDTYGPIGPVLVSVDALADRDNIPMTCDINGEQRQSDSTASLIFDVPTLIEYISSIMTLAPGDMIFTGTPEGIGATQGKFLMPGDTIVSTIDGIGTMTNVCR